MSLMSLLNTGLNQTSSATSATSAAAAMQRAMAAAQARSMSSFTGSTKSEVTISAAAAEKADNAKDFTALAKEVRAALDAQYAAATVKGDANPKPDLSGLTGRALAAVALNKSGGFTRSEVRAAKEALNQQTRQDFASAMAGGTDLSAIGSYGQSIVTRYDAMSPEEREARGWTEKLRTASETSYTAASSSLFGLLDG